MAVLPLASLSETSGLSGMARHGAAPHIPPKRRLSLLTLTAWPAVTAMDTAMVISVPRLAVLATAILEAETAPCPVSVGMATSPAAPLNLAQFPTAYKGRPL